MPAPSVVVNSTSSSIVRYAIAVLVIGVFLVIRLALQPWLGLSVPYLQFFPAIMYPAPRGLRLCGRLGP